jgi:Putative beta-barrel porin 2
LRGSTAYEAWTLHFRQIFAHTRQSLVQTAQQTSETMYDTSLNVGYQFGSNLASETTFGHALRQTNGFSDVRDLSVLEYLNMSIATDLSTALGVKVGYVMIDPGADISYGQLLGRVKMRIIDRLALELQAGLNSQRFQKQAAETHTTPIFVTGLRFKAMRDTDLVLTAERSVLPSYFSDQTVTSAQYRLALEQVVRAEMKLSSGFTYGTSRYSGAGFSDALPRSDHFYSVDIQLTTTLRNRLTAGLVFAHRKNSSSQDGFDFSSDQYGLQFAYRY